MFTIYILNLWAFILYLRYAGQVSVGDEVLVNKNGEMIPTEIVNISDFIMQGNNHADLYGLFFKHSVLCQPEKSDVLELKGCK